MVQNPKIMWKYCSKIGVTILKMIKIIRNLVSWRFSLILIFSMFISQIVFITVQDPTILRSSPIHLLNIQYLRKYNWMYFTVYFPHTSYIPNRLHWFTPKLLWFIYCIYTSKIYVSIHTYFIFLRFATPLDQKQSKTSYIYTC